MSNHPHPRWALILGASSGFGAAAARALAADGFHIAGVHLDRRSTIHFAEELESELKAAGVKTRFFNINAADPDKRSQCLDSMAEELEGSGGEIACLLHSLAFGSLLPFVPALGESQKTVTSKQMVMTQEVMANSLVYWTQDVVARGMMNKGGRIFAMTSTGAHEVSPSYGVVSAAKAALESHCRQLSYELLERQITVNSICAGVTETAALKKIPGHEDLIRKSRDKSPIDRLTHPEDVGGAIAALMDPRLYWLTGNILGIHGGEDVIG